MSGLLYIVLTRVLGNPNPCPYACMESTLQTEPAPQPQGRALAGSPSIRAALAEQEVPRLCVCWPSSWRPWAIFSNVPTDELPDNIMLSYVHTEWHPRF